MAGKEYRKICIRKLYEMYEEEKKAGDDPLARNALWWAATILENVQNEMVTKEITQEEADCIMNHIQAFKDQCGENRPADWGEPCAKCEHAEKCRFDWLSKMQKVINRSNVGLDLAMKGRSSSLPD